MATLDDLSAALVKADAAGNADDAKQIADAIRQLQGQAAAPTAPQVPAPAAPQGRGLADYVMGSDGGPSLAGSAMSTLNHAVTDIPVVGPLLQGAGDQLAAQTVGRLQGQDPAEYIKNAEASRAAMDAANPVARVAGAVGGNLAAVGATGGTDVGAAALGLTGKTLPRIANGLLSYTGLTAGDNMARGEQPTQALSDALTQGPSVGGVTVPGSAIAAAIPGFGAAAKGVARGLGYGLDASAVPTTQALKSAAGDLYDSARASGATAPQSATIKLSDDLFDIARNEGLVSPTGALADSYPKIKTILSQADDYSQGEMSVPQIQAFRRTLQDAAQSNDAGERRVGSMMLSRFDQTAQQTAPELKEAAGLYRSAKQGEMMDEVSKLASANAGQYSGSGYENALRTQFRGLDKQIARGDLNVTPSQQQAIQNVARGTPASNIARGIGKFAPTGVVSAMGSGGLPFMVGNAMGGPVAGALAGAGTMGAGLLGRSLATGAGLRNADIAAALMRNGGKALPEAAMPKITNAQLIAQSLLLGSP